MTNSYRSPRTLHTPLGRRSSVNTPVRRTIPNALLGSTPEWNQRPLGHPMLPSLVQTASAPRDGDAACRRKDHGPHAARLRRIEVLAGLVIAGTPAKVQHISVRTPPITSGQSGIAFVSESLAPKLKLTTEFPRFGRLLYVQSVECCNPKLNLSITLQDERRGEQPFAQGPCMPLRAKIPLRAGGGSFAGPEQDTFGAQGGCA